MSQVEDIRAHLAERLPRPDLSPIGLHDFLALKLPPREHVLAPWLPVKGLAMIYAAPGVGKTHLALEAAYAVALGANFLGWKAPRPRPVFYVDGEMPGEVMQERLAAIVERYDADAPAAAFDLLSADFKPSGIPDLSEPEGQAALAEHIGAAELIVFDNLSTLFRSGRENEAESWAMVQPFFLALRRQGRAVVLVHHAGKGGSYRGTSKRLDVLDSVLRLARPDDYDASQGARFTVTFEKARGLFGPDAEPFEAWLDDGQWRRQSLADATNARIIELTAEGLNYAEIGRELDLDRATVKRRADRLKADGRLP
jgi:putative DNA primase/helicase